MTPAGPFVRTLILGNSGSGKSWLSVRLAEAVGARATDLDEIHWEPGGYGAARDRQAAIEDVGRLAATPAWVIEGVYGWLAREAVGRATALIWLDLPIEECIANLRRRGPRRGGDDAAFAALLAWTVEYPRRRTSSSFGGHEEFFVAFPGRKLRLFGRTEIAGLLAGLRRDDRRP